MPSTPIEHWDYTINEWNSGTFAPILNSLPTEISVFYDIGANVGGFSHIIHQKNPNAQIFTFEPVKSNFEALEQNLPYATNFNFGIFYGARESKALWRGDNIGAIFVEQIDSGEPRIWRDYEKIQLKTLEELDIPPPEVIKMDIEGAEENVLEHSDICRKAPWIVLEWHPNTNPFEFFKKYLPNHEIVENVQNCQFLLKLK